MRSLLKICELWDDKISWRWKFVTSCKICTNDYVVKHFFKQAGGGGELIILSDFISKHFQKNLNERFSLQKIICCAIDTGKLIIRVRVDERSSDPNHRKTSGLLTSLVIPPLFYLHPLLYSPIPPPSLPSLAFSVFDFFALTPFVTLITDPAHNISMA